MARVLFVEPFHGGSHRAFLDGLARHSRHEIVTLTLPEGEWRRRMRLGAQELAAAATSVTGDFDALIATDMLDLPAFLALSRPRFAALPILLYMHENQFTYPRLRGTKLNSWFGQINYLSACAANRVAFNSDYHRRDFLSALRTLAGQPNNWLLPSAIDTIAEKSEVLPVGVELDWLDAHRSVRDPGLPPLVLWNHRWEFDKAPETFARAIRKLVGEGLDFRLALAGAPSPNPSPALTGLAVDLPGLVEQAGYLPGRDAYARLLWESAVVVSTARHEFFGVGMVEALHCGCFPVAPAQFNYPALVPVSLHARCLWHSEEQLVELLRGAILAPPDDGGAFRESAARFAWSRVAPAWDEAITALIRKGHRLDSR
ncbi:MAG: DUF3524 domain-containing protein [Chloroflexi bacterium]|nr:DUF3524 domain-containing protein [Chloroflexota bacterium]